MLGFTPTATVPIADDTVTTLVVISASLVGTSAVGAVSLVTNQQLAQTGLVATSAMGVVARWNGRWDSS